MARDASPSSRPDSGPAKNDDPGRETASGRDVVIVHGVTEDEKGLRVLRARERSLELGEVRPLEEGKPLQGDVVRLKPRPNAPFVCDVETAVSLAELQKRSGAARPALAAPQKSHPGPARVATDAYRANWDAIWSRPNKPSSELN